MRQPDGPLFSFLFVNDVHVSTDDDEHYLAESIDEWRAVRSLFDFVVMCGDMANNGTIAELIRTRRQIERLGKPYYPVLGNHDTTGPGETGKSAYREVFGVGREDYVFAHRGVTFVVIDIAEGMDANVAVRDHTTAWLAQALDQIPPDAPLIVLTHFPLHPDTPRFAAENSDGLFCLLDSRPVLAYFAGHYHGKFHTQRNGVDFFGNTCMSLAVNNTDGTTEEGCILVHVHTDRVAVEFFERGKTPGM